MLTTYLEVKNGRHQGTIDLNAHMIFRDIQILLCMCQLPLRGSSKTQTCRNYHVN